MGDLLAGLPGEDLVRQGLADLTAGRETTAAFLVSIGSSWLRSAGLEIPPTVPDADHRLYLLLAQEFGDDAHSRYNSLLRRLVSFEQALDCAS
jgi:hypothetical protein